MQRCRVWLPWISMLVLASGCGGPKTDPGPSVTPPSPKVASAPVEKPAAARPVSPPPPPPLVVTPQSSVLKPGDPGLQFLTAGDGLPSSIEWSVEPSGLATLEPGGYLRPVEGASGKVKVTAQGGGRTGVAEVVIEGGTPRPWDFGTDIVPIFTKAGCNVGGCHGRAEGQNGFHLSLFGYDPAGDHEAITRDSGGRRIERMAPAESLLLEKATGTIPHKGGRRIVPETPEYQTILAWIRDGAPLVSGPSHGEVVNVEVLPSARILPGTGAQQLRVVATFSDKHQRDVTRAAIYKVNDDSVLSADQNGLVRLLRRSESDVIVRHGSRVIPTRIGTVVNPDLKYDFAARPRKNFIDTELFKRLESLKIPPSPPADDATFLRRVTLDLTGQQPLPEQVREFLKETDPSKREKLVDRLLASRDFVRFWQIKFGDLLEITTSRPELAQTAFRYQTWLSTRLLENAPWDGMVRELLTAVGDPMVKEGGPVSYALEGIDPKVQAEKTAQRFMGLRLRCAQCHDHPFDIWTQDDYFGMAALFAKVSRNGDGNMQGRLQVRINPKGEVVHLRTRKAATPKILGGSIVKVAEKDDPRKTLADWMTQAENPYFARATANWVWAQMFGKGLCDPADDLSRANPPVHPELLDALAKHFVKSKFNLRDLIRTIACSEAYGLSSSTVPGNESDQKFLSHQVPRPLTAHQMADAIAQATDVINRFRDKAPGTRAIEINDPSTPSAILEAFGRCNRQNGCAVVSTPSLGLRQSLLLIGGDVIEGKVTNLQGYLSNILSLQLPPEEIVENLYVRTVCRMPTAEEASHWTGELSKATSLKEAAEDLFWALLNSREFAFNH